MDDRRAAVAVVVAMGCLAAAGTGSGEAPTARDDTITVVARPPLEGTNAFYHGSRPPLAPKPLIKLPIGAIEPRGWLRGQLELMRDGMTGHLPEHSHWVQRENNAWLSKEGKGENGWEELPYWLKGYGDLGYVLKDERITADAKAWMEGVMAAQRPDGYFGSEENRAGGPDQMQLGVAKKNVGPDLWPHMPMIDALKSYHEASGGAGDERVIGFLTRYFKWQASLPKDQLLPGSWQKLRGGDNLESVLWLYNRTAEGEGAWLLDLARALHERTSPWVDKIASLHGVNFCQGFREPGVFWQLSRNQKDLDAVERNYAEMMGRFGEVPGGMFGADEVARPGFGDPRQAAETCSMVEFMSSFEQLLSITGDPVYADRCEEVAFNDLPAAFAPDYKGLHYLTSPNMVQLDKESKAPGLMNGGTMVSYDPGEVYRCCQHNHAMGWPYFAEHLWMATADNGLAAVFLGENEVRAKVGDGQEVTIRERSDYPFGESVRFEVSLKGPAQFPLYLRIPAWAAGAEVQGPGAAWTRCEAGKYVKISRRWQDGDAVNLKLPMEVGVTTWPKNMGAASVRRGPLWYSVRIGERYEEYKGSSGAPAFEVFAASPWNYGLVLPSSDPGSSFKVVTTAKAPGPQPFTLDTSPIVLQARARKIHNWTQDRRGLVGLLQQGPIRSSEPDETINLIPMGAARLRITAFPMIGESRSANEWSPPPTARHDTSYEFDDIGAISDGQEPKNSNDHSIPRYTWWDHLGTTEWVTYKFEKPRAASSCSVYWFDDTGVGRCRVPASWKVLYRDGNAWKEVVGASGYGVKADEFNAVKFAPVTTSELKLEVTLQKEVSGGILEWKVAE